MNYLITFRTYGTWLHGDERYSVHQKQNTVGEPLLESRPFLERFEKNQMRGERVAFDIEQRECVEATIHETANCRGWTIQALAVQTNHVHIVVSAECAPEKVMSDFKSYATRRLRERKLVPANAPLWSKHGSTKYLNTQSSSVAACQYVAENQADLTDCP